MAKAIHHFSQRKDKPFIDVHCGAIALTLIESELFGVCAGGATQVVEKEGFFEQADKGTIFLDEIGTMPLDQQTKLLKVLESRKLKRVQSKQKCICKNKTHRDHTAIDIDVRIVAATNTNIPDAIKEGEFREDLYYRLNVINIHVPALRERKEDIEILFKNFVNVIKIKLGKPEFLDVYRPDVKELFESYDWPGNIRQLRGCIESAMSNTNSPILVKSDFSLEDNGKEDKVPYDISTIIGRCINGEIGYKEIKRIAPIKTPAMKAILEGICIRYYEINGDLSEDLLVPVLQLNTRANVHRVLQEHGISTTELKQKFKNMRGSE